MIKIEHTEVFGWSAAIRGMRNAMNSWDKSDSYWTHIEDAETLETAPFAFFLGENDLKLAKSLSKGGDDHGKFLRMINVQLDITAPLYWWKEADTYRIGKEQNSCSTMHKIHTKEFVREDFSVEHVPQTGLYGECVEVVINALNTARKAYLLTKDKSFWWQMIQLLPSSYNQRRTVQLNYQVLKNMYFARRHHKLDEWREFCRWCESLPYFRELCIQE